MACQADGFSDFEAASMLLGEYYVVLPRLGFSGNSLLWLERGFHFR